MLFNIEVLNEIKDILIKRKETLSVAESVTSGFLQIAFSTAENASFYFQGGITVYNIGQKCRHLSVNAVHALECNCVSENIALQMAISANQFFTSDYSIGITGYATPLPEKEINVLYAHYSIAHKNKILLTKRIESEASPGTPTQIFYAEQVIKD